MEFSTEKLDFECRELAEFLIHETGQQEGKLDVDNILQYLGLTSLQFSFDRELPIEKNTRALLSYPDKIIAVEENLKPERKRFSFLHEVGHYVLPNHQSSYLCDDKGLSAFSHLTHEKEANEFAAELLFMGNQFLLQINSLPINAKTVKKLADQYYASFESTARRLAEKNSRPCMFIRFNRNQTAQIELSGEDIWSAQYSIPSSIFKQKYGREFKGIVPCGIVNQLIRSSQDITDSIVTQEFVNTVSGRSEMSFEYFYNQYNILAFLIPK
ncbi:MAG: ImmA/IrrE family metallo-endopeptidase [Phycisphaerae bacterium]|nr:ImmA/IrrE family metallo-endopeptidase [Phycisphaerae bacterium]